MANPKTSKKLKGSKRKLLTVHDPYSAPELRNVELTIEILLDCILEGDSETFRDVLLTHLKAVNKVDFVQKAGIGRRTLYDLLDPNKVFNPEFSTISALFHALKAA